jgi:hypothetical protein
MALPPTSTSIDTLNAMAAHRRYLSISLIPPGCRWTAADANGDSIVTTVDVIAIQRFFIGRTFGTGNVGKYRFTPASRTYPKLGSDQTEQNFDALVYGDVGCPLCAMIRAINALSLPGASLAALAPLHCRFPGG